jgi:hypothetical protein
MTLTAVPPVGSPTAMVLVEPALVMSTEAPVIDQPTSLGLMKAALIW